MQCSRNIKCSKVKCFEGERSLDPKAWPVQASLYMSSQQFCKEAHCNFQIKPSAALQQAALYLKACFARLTPFSHSLVWSAKPGQVSCKRPPDSIRKPAGSLHQGNRFEGSHLPSESYQVLKSQRCAASLQHSWAGNVPGLIALGIAGIAEQVSTSAAGAASRDIPNAGIPCGYTCHASNCSQEWLCILAAEQGWGHGGTARHCATPNLSHKQTTQK